jgi:hypothetical protein
MVEDRVLWIELMKRGIKIEKPDVCPFFFIYDWQEKDAYACKEKVNLYYTVEYCIKNFRKCKAFIHRTMTEMRSPGEWMALRFSSLGMLSLDESFETLDYIKCPMYPECKVRVNYRHFENKCCMDFDTCDSFMEKANHTRYPAEWFKNLKMIVYVEGNDKEKR